MLVNKDAMPHVKKRYEHKSASVTGNEAVKAMWDILVQFDGHVKARKPDIILTDKKGENGVVD